MVRAHEKFDDPPTNRSSYLHIPVLLYWTLISLPFSGFFSFRFYWNKERLLRNGHIWDGHNMHPSFSDVPWCIKISCSEILFILRLRRTKPLQICSWKHWSHSSLLRHYVMFHAQMVRLSEEVLSFGLQFADNILGFSCFFQEEKSVFCSYLYDNSIHYIETYACSFHNNKLVLASS